MSDARRLPSKTVFVVAPSPEDPRGFGTYDDLGVAEHAAQDISRRLPAHLDGEAVRVLQAVLPDRVGGRPRPDTGYPEPLSIFVDGVRRGT
jgi:hypothetical protein